MKSLCIVFKPGSILITVNIEKSEGNCTSSGKISDVFTVRMARSLSLYALSPTHRPRVMLTPTVCSLISVASRILTPVKIETQIEKSLKLRYSHTTRIGITCNLKERILNEETIAQRIDNLHKDV